MHSQCQARVPEALGRPYNLADGTGVTWRRYIDALADGLGQRRPWINIPSTIAFPLARSLELTHQLLRLPGRPLLTRNAVYLLCRNQEYPIEKAKCDLGFSPTISFDEGVTQTVNLLRNQPLI